MKTLYALTIAAAVAMMRWRMGRDDAEARGRDLLYANSGALLDPEKDDGSMISIEECAKQMLV